MTELDLLRAATKKALALLAHSLAFQQDAKLTLENLMANYAAAKSSGPADDFDELVVPMLLSLSSLALKQHPEDSDLLATYQSLRPGPRQ